MSEVPRKIEQKIIDSQLVMPITFLNGPRQCGKSTLVQSDSFCSKVGNSTYVSFDRPVQMAAANANPETFLTSAKGTRIIDEVQMVPALFRALKIVVDELRIKDKQNANGRYLLTGSANILALPALSEALVGRMSVLTLYPFAVCEFLQTSGDGLNRMFTLNFENISDKGISLIDAISMATFPEIAGKNIKERNIWFDSYLATILQRDVKMLADLEKISVLPTLLRVLAIRAGGLINDSNIAREVGLNSVTGKFYRNILKMMFLNFDIQPWFKNIGKRLVKAPKGYLIDTLMMCHLMDIDIKKSREKDPVFFGHIIENFVATELIKLLSFSDIKAELLHFRTSDGKEIDFVLERPDGSILAIEIKSSELVSEHDFKNIRLLAELNKNKLIGGIVLYSGKEPVPFGENLWAVPFHILWQ